MRRPSYKFPATTLLATRSRLLREYPRLANNEAYWRMLIYVFNGCKYGLGYEIGKNIMKSNASFGQFLQDFKRDILPNFSWTEHLPPEELSNGEFLKGEERRLECNGLDSDELIEYWKMSRLFLQCEKEMPRVLISDGSLWTVRREKKRQSLNDSVMLQIAQYGNETQNMILTYHSALPHRIYTRLTRINKRKVLDWISTVTDPTCDLIAQAEGIAKHPKPYYCIVSDKTDRLYPARGVPNLTSCKREIRKLYMSGCYEADIWCCHLSIIASEWDIKSLKQLLSELLSAGKKSWLWFAEQLGLPMTKELKDALKEAVYSICYGASKKSIKSRLEKRGFSCGDSFLNMPIIIDILKARSQVMKINNRTEEDFAPCCYQDGLLDETDLRSLLSCHAQSIEQKLVGAIYDFAIKNKDSITILVYEYDGVTFSVTENTRKSVDKLKSRLKLAVETKAKELGLITTLDIDD